MTALDLCNNALALLGEKPIDGIDPNGFLPQRMCYLHYHPTRGNVLCAHNWLFAAKKATLDSFATEDADHHAIPHAIPRDALRILECSCPGWTLRGRQIFAWPQQIEITYTRDEEDLDLWSADALYLFTHLLAAKMCIPLINSTTLRSELMAQYDTKLKSITNPTK